MYFVGSTNSKGSYFWWSEHHRAWIVANLEFEKATMWDELAMFQVNRDVDPTPERWILAEEEIEKSKCNKFLVPRKHITHFIRKLREEMDFEVLMIYHNDGSMEAYGKDDIRMAEIVNEFHAKGVE